MRTAVTEWFSRQRWAALSSGALFAVAVLAVASVVFAALAYHRHHLVDARAAEVRESVAAEIGSLTADVLSYRAETVEGDVEQAKSRLSDPFLDEYTALTTSTVIPRATQGEVTTRWQATGSSLVSADEDRAVVLVFLRGITSAAAAPEPQYLTSSVRVCAHRPHGQWLITELEAL